MRGLPRGPWPTALVILGFLLAGGLAIVLLDPSGTDEDEYMPLAFGDFVSSKDPYRTTHEADRATYARGAGLSDLWTTSYPYLPVLALLQVPFLDYRWTALAAYGALLAALRDRRVAFFAFANPLVLALAVNGFNDFVPLALLAWADRTRRDVPMWLACAAKQFAPLLVALDLGLRRAWRRLAMAAAFTLAVTMPYVVWDPGAFVRAAVLHNTSLLADPLHHANYALYPLYALAVVVPGALASRRGATSGAVVSPAV